MIKKLKVLVVLCICAASFTNLTYGQSTYKIKDTKGYDIQLLGTSSLHDWEMTALSSTGDAHFHLKTGSTSELVSISALSFAIQVSDLKSDNSGLNKNAHKALKADKYKEISYKLTSAIVTKLGDDHVIKSKGNLSIAGVTKNIDLLVSCSISADGTISLEGSYDLKMTDYGITPPSFMWGAMTTGDAVTLNFKVDYKK